MLEDLFARGVSTRVRRGLLLFESCSWTPWLVLVPERKPKLPHNLRPEFSKHVEADVSPNIKGHPRRRRSYAAFVVRVIGVAQHNGARRTQPFRKIEHLRPIFPVGHDGMFQAVKEALSFTPVSQAVVPRVLGKIVG